MAGKRKKMQEGGPVKYDFTSGKSADQIIAELKKIEGQKTAAEIGMGAAAGAVGGSAVPGLGTLFGGLMGAGTAAVKRLTATSGNKDIYEGIENQYSKYTQNVRKEGARARFGYKKGGKIKGAGTGKSDSIKTSLPEGAFVVPAENADIAMDIGLSLLGWKLGQKAVTRKSGVDVSVSNGEVLFEPPEVKALESLNIDLSVLASNAEKGATKLKEGTDGPFQRTDGPRRMVDDQYESDTEFVLDIIGKSKSFEESLKGKYAKTALGGAEKSTFDISKMPEPPVEAFSNLTAKAELGGAEKSTFDISKMPEPPVEAFGNLTAKDAIDQVMAAKVTPDPGKDPSAWSQLDAGTKAGMITGGAQAIGGIAGLIAAPNAQGLTVSDDLNQLVTETAREAEYGFEPREKASMERKIQRNTNMALNKVESEFAGGPASTYNRIAGILTEGNEALNDLAVADEGVKRDKKREARGYKGMRAKRKDYIQEFEFADARQNQELLADVTTAGLDNIMGSLQFSQYVKAKKERDSYGGSLIG